MTMRGYRCKFPFKYKGKEYRSCVIRYNGDKAFCAISTDKENLPVITDVCYEDYGMLTLLD